MLRQPCDVQNVVSVRTVFGTVETHPARPFVKWVGGKSQLLDQLQVNFPTQLETGEINTYVEPFVGGGAVFFYIAANFRAVKRFVIADNNADLIIAYMVIRERVAELIANLLELQNRYLRLSEDRRQDFYYKMRTSFNRGRSKLQLSTFSEHWIERTAQLVFLNKTCFNGLFRVNSAGDFNVAFGKYENPKICDIENLINVSHVLKRAEILLGDFENVFDYIDEKSFVYLDPPYRPLTETSNFTGYSPTTFTALDQQRLASFCAKVDRLGAKFLLSNSDPQNVDPDDRYFESTYDRFRILRISASRMVNCKADKRGKISELLIMNY